MAIIIDKKLLDEYDTYVKKEHLLPIKVTEFYQKKVIEEINTIGHDGPLFRTVFPSYEKLHMHSSMETRDYVEEYSHMPVPEVDYIIQKYQNRILVIITEECFAHCQYCFRTYNLCEFKKNIRYELSCKIKIIKEYLLNHSEVSEVILSGGDPLSIGEDNLAYVLNELDAWDVRIHTRAIVYEPMIFTDRLIELLSNHDVRLVFHINHPYEICNVVSERIQALNKAGIKMYSQFPLIRGINDHPTVLVMLLELMDKLHIRPISIFIPDPIMYCADFRVSFKRLISIMDFINWNTPAWINSVRFVMDTTYGKVRRENIVSIEGKHIVFLRNDHYIDYYDLDDNCDIPGDIKKMLWKELSNNGDVRT